MMTEDLPILRQDAVAQRVSAATRTALQQRSNPPAYSQFLSREDFTTLQQIVDTVLPQNSVGTAVNIAEGIDRRLAEGKNVGWRFAVLPPDGEAYRQGLGALRLSLAATPMKSFEHMSATAREAYLRCIANGEADESARFPLSTFLTMLRTDIVRIWMSHPDTMNALNLYSFATGATGLTNGPTQTEGWQQITPGTAKAFEHGNPSVEREA